MQTRRATLNDIPWLLDQLWDFERFCNTKHSLIPTQEGAATQMLSNLIHDTFFVIVETPNGHQIGFICAVLTPHIFNPEVKIFTELFWWVMPVARGTRAGALLLAEFMAYGRANAQMITLALEDHSPVNPNSLVKRGFRLKEHSYLLEV